MAGDARRRDTLRFYKQALLGVLVHIQARLDDPLELAALAALARLSPYHFHRVFHGMVGESLMAHIRRLRLERAALQLKTGSRPVIDIALAAGYETHESFTRAFRASFGASPSAYRSRHGARVHLKSPSGVHFRAGGGLHDFRSTHPPRKTMNITIKQLSPVRVAFLRHGGPYHEVGQTWGRLTMLLGQEGLLGPGTRFLGISHDDPEITPPDRLRYDACVTVDDAFQPAGEIGVQIIAGGAYAVATHAGPYERLSRTYRAVMGQWLPRSGFGLRMVPCFEAYLNTPENTEAADLLTDVHVPVEPLRTASRLAA
jgi:AraC family transcriptional regulator